MVPSRAHLRSTRGCSRARRNSCLPSTTSRIVTTTGVGLGYSFDVSSGLANYILTLTFVVTEAGVEAHTTNTGATEFDLRRAGMLALQ